MSSQSIGYIRVSTREQSTGRQSDGMESLKLDKVFTEKVSGKSKDRPELNACITYAREGDTVYIYSIDRLARSLGDLEAIINELVTKGVTVTFIKESQTYSRDNSNPFNKVLLQVLGAFAEFERNIMLERQAEGIAHAKLNGTKSGKPFGKQPLDMSRRQEAIEYSKQGMNITEIAKAMSLSRASIYKLLS
jgi:DNA invertase Pin-like site-specific DNA recombinase